MKKKLKTWWMQKCIELCVRLMNRYELDIYRFSTGIQVYVRSRDFEVLSSGCAVNVVEDNKVAVLNECKKNGIVYHAWVWKENHESS